MISKKAKRLLTKLANGLEKKVKPEWFDLSSWAEHGWKRHKCGTTACAAGWATTLVPESGLRLDREIELVHGRGWRTRYGFGACQSAFDLNFEQVIYLFDGFHYDRGRKIDVIRRIRKFVKTGGEMP